MRTKRQAIEAKPSHRRLRALAFVASAVFFVLSLVVFLHDANRHRRSKVEPLSPATIIATRSAKSSGYATVKFEINAEGEAVSCVEEIWLARYFREYKIGDTVYVFPNSDYCSVPIWPKIPTLFDSFLICFAAFLIMVLQTGKYIDAVRAFRKDHAMALSLTETRNM